MSHAPGALFVTTIPSSDLQKTSTALPIRTLRGRCHSKTCGATIADPETQVLLQLKGECDGTHAGQFSSFELTRLQIALDLLTRQAREKDCNWGMLGWIPNIQKDKSQGRRSFVDSGQADSTRFCAQLSHDEGSIGVNGNTHPSQDLHAVISHVPKGLVELQKTGFKWDLMHKGKLHKDVTMIPRLSGLRGGHQGSRLCLWQMRQSQQTCQAALP